MDELFINPYRLPLDISLIVSNIAEKEFDI